MEQLSKEQAKLIFESRVWEKWSDTEILRLQLFQDNMCVPFGRYHSALERYLGRPVYTHTLDHNKPKLIKEFLGANDAPALEEVIGIIPLGVFNYSTNVLIPVSI